MLTQTQLDQFHRDGFLVLRGMFQGAELAALCAAADTVTAEGLAHTGEHHLYRAMPDGSQRYFRSERMWERAPEFRAATVQPTLLAAIGQCLGEAFLPVNDSFVVKTPHSEVPILWHQDPPSSNPAWTATHPVPNFDTDIYLDHSTIANGCVWGIPGHHLVGHVDMASYSQEQLFTDFGAVPLKMAPGDVLFHCLSAPHGSIGNTTATTRRIFYVHYMARAILEDCYPQMTKGDPRQRGWNPAFRARIDSFLGDRRALGWETDLAAAQVAWGDAGFRFTGSPVTPPRHWGSLIAAMPEAELTAKRHLRWLAAAR